MTDHHRDRSSSAVRDLRAKFETNDQNASPSRGRSPVGSINGDTHVILSGPIRIQKVRTSFVSVEPSGNQVSTSKAAQPNVIESSAIQSKQNAANSAIVDLKPGTQKAIPVTKGKDDKETKVSAKAATTATQKSGTAKPNGTAAKPVKPTTVASTAPAKTTSKASVPSSTTPKSATSAKSTTTTIPKTSAKPAQTTTNSIHPPKSSRTSLASNTSATSAKSTKPVKVTTTQSSGSASGSTVSKTKRTSMAHPAAQATTTIPKPLSSHLTAPTTASAAKHESADSRKPSGPSSKPLSASSHLLAPTAASVARAPRTSMPAAGSTNSVASGKDSGKRERASLAPQLLTTKRTSAPRSSLAAQPPSEGFLSRMMKPTVASARKTTEKVEQRSPPRKVSGTAKPPATKPTSKPATPSSKSATVQVSSAKSNGEAEADAEAKPETSAIESEKPAEVTTPTEVESVEQPNVEDGIILPSTPSFNEEVIH